MFTNEVIEQLVMKVRLEYMEKVRSIDTSSLSYDKSDTVTLFHGTTTAYLNFILRGGILPRSQTGNGNWEGEVSSIENVTYLTNKWHYFYAMNAHMNYTKNEQVNEPESSASLPSLPCYVECKVPKDLLVVDEDYLLTSHFQQKIKSYTKKNPKAPFEEVFTLIEPMECLAQNATVGVLGTIPPSMIVSFTVLGDENLFRYLTDNHSPYMRDWNKWRQGKGKGKVKLQTLLEKEAESSLNGSWHKSQVRENTLITFAVNPNTGNLAMYQK